MCSETQINANRLNAQKSTGPRTPEGKSKVSQNAVTHGLTALRPVLATEDPNEYTLFRNDFFRHHAPVGILEETLVERAAESFWRLCRASTFETQVLNNLAKESQNPKSDTECHSRDLSAIALATAEGGNPDSFAKALINDFRNTHILERLLGYELKIERSHYRTLRELRQLQSLRLNQDQGKQGLVRSADKQVVPVPAFTAQNKHDSANQKNKPKIPPFNPLQLLENIKTNPFDLDPLTKIMMKKDNFRPSTKKAM